MVTITRRKLGVYALILIAGLGLDGYGSAQQPWPVCDNKCRLRDEHRMCHAEETPLCFKYETLCCNACYPPDPSNRCEKQFGDIPAYLTFCHNTGVPLSYSTYDMCTDVCQCGVNGIVIVEAFITGDLIQTFWNSLSYYNCRAP
jgi:hypothetical protein